MSDTLKITATESVTVVHSGDPALFEVEAAYGPASKPPPPHFHPEQEEHFEVLEGQMTVRIDGTERTLHTGDTLDVPGGTKHTMWNSGDGQARLRWQTMPAGRTEEWFRTWDQIHRDGKAGANGLPSLDVLGALLTEYRDVFRLAVGPDPVVRTALAGLGAVGRLRGATPARMAPAGD